MLLYKYPVIHTSKTLPKEYGRLESKQQLILNNIFKLIGLHLSTEMER